MPGVYKSGFINSSYEVQLPKPPKSFCVAPWVHAHVGANGKRRLCCVARQAPDHVAQLSWKQFKNSDYLKDIRTKMMSGVTPPECQICDNSNRSDNTRDVLNEFYASKIAKIIETTAKDGTSQMPLSYIDYRSNLCNLKCRMCDPDTSSSYQIFVNKQPPEIGRELFGDGYLRDANGISAYFSKHYAQECLELIETEDLDRFYFAGGEPLIEPNHIPILKRLVKSGRAPSISLFYNTNFSYSQSLIESWLDQLKFFKSCVIYVSIDGFGKICEYIRAGSKFEKIDNNVDFILKNTAPNTTVKFDLTITSLNLFFLEEFANYVLSKKMILDAKLMISGDPAFPLLRAEAVPLEFKNQVLVRWKRYFSKLRPQEQALLANLNAVLQIFETRESWGMVDADRLRLYESMYPNKPRFVDLLRGDKIGAVWAEQLDRRRENETL